MALRQQPDYFMPISDRNRKEVMLVPYNNIIRSINQPIIYYMKDHPDEFPLEKYPGLKKLIETDSGDGLDYFTIGITCPTRLILALLRDPDLGKDMEKIKEEPEDHKIIDDIRTKYDPAMSYHTRLEAAFLQLYKYSGIVKELIVSDPLIDSDIKLRALVSRMFPIEEGGSSAIVLSRYNTHTLLKNDPKITTVFIEEIGEAIYLLENLTEEILSGKAFFIQANCRTALLTRHENAENLSVDDMYPLEYLEYLANKKKVQLNFFASMLFSAPEPESTDATNKEE